MKLVYLLTALLLSPAGPLLAQSKPATRPASKASLVAANSPEARVEQYFSDLAQRLRDIYYAPSDARATALLSTAVQEFGARRQGLRSELRQAGRLKLATDKQAQWQKILDELDASAPAAKFAVRCQRNPALETAYLRFVEARLSELVPTADREAK